MSPVDKELTRFAAEARQKQKTAIFFCSVLQKYLHKKGGNCIYRSCRL
jgi:hypothetical protein